MTRFIKKIEKSDEYLDSVLNFSTLSEEKVMQNVALEIYEDYFDKVSTLARFFNVKRFSWNSSKMSLNYKNNAKQGVVLDTLYWVLAKKCQHWTWSKFFLIRKILQLTRKNLMWKQLFLFRIHPKTTEILILNDQ